MNSAMDTMEHGFDDHDRSNKEGKDIEEAVVDIDDEKQDRNKIPIDSQVLGKEQAVALRKQLDKDSGDNQVSAIELGQLAEDIQQTKEKVHRYQKAVIGLVAATILLLGTSFASSWVAMKFQKDLETNDENNLLIATGSGQAVATLVHNQICNVKLNHDAYRNLHNQRKLMSEDDFQRHLQEENLVVFNVSAACVEHSWQMYRHGNLGVMQFSANSAYTPNGVLLGLVSTDSVARDVVESAEEVIYGPVHSKSNPDVQYGIVCPMNQLGIGEECQGFVLNMPQEGRKKQRALYYGIPECLRTGRGCSPPEDDDSGGCFSPFSTVQLEDGRVKAMNDLKLGDNVLVGQNKYQKIYGFAHNLPKEQASKELEYIKLTLQNHKDKAAVLELTPNHLIYKIGDDVPVPASLLQKTDILVGNNGEPLAIKKIQSVFRRGAYVPLTLDGTVVVGGAMASTYISYQEDSPTLSVAGVETGLSWHWIAHTFMKPLSVYCNNYPGNGFCHGETYMANGKNFYSDLGSRIVKEWVWGVQNPILQALAFVMVFSLVIFAYFASIVIELCASVSLTTLFLVLFFMLSHMNHWNELSTKIQVNGAKKKTD